MLSAVVQMIASQNTGSPRRMRRKSATDDHVRSAGFGAFGASLRALPALRLVPRAFAALAAHAGREEADDEAVAHLGFIIT